MELLYRTVGGSRLYGLSHSDSDYDYFEVYSGKRKMRHQKNGDQDEARVSLNQFLLGLDKGVPQYLEALWAPEPEVNGLDWLRASWRPGLPRTTETYLRTIKSFWLAGDFKSRRHSARLYLNLTDLHRYGRFTPVLTPAQTWWCNNYARNGEEVLTL